MRTWEQKMSLKDQAAHLTMTRPHLMSHDSAARILGLPMLHPPGPLVHVTRFGVGGSRTQDGVKHHLTRLGLLGTTNRDSMRATSVARTALDLGREHGFVAGTVAIDAARQRGIEVADLESELIPMWCWPGITDARAALENSDPDAQSIGETLLRLFLCELGLGDVETQFPVQVGSTVFWCDLRVGRQLYEFDGKLKYLRPNVGGVAEKDPAEVVWEEKRRQDAICAQQLGMSRVVWDELFGTQRSRLGVRLRAEHAGTTELFGDRLPDALANNAKRLRKARQELAQRNRATRQRQL